MPQPPLLGVAFGMAFVYIFIPVPVKLHASPHSGDVAAKFLLAPFLFTDVSPLALFDDVVAAQCPSVAGLRHVPRARISNSTVWASRRFAARMKLLMSLSRRRRDALIPQ